MLTATLRALMQPCARCRSHEANQLLIHFCSLVIRAIRVVHIHGKPSRQLTNHVAGSNENSHLPSTFSKSSFRMVTRCPAMP